MSAAVNNMNVEAIQRAIESGATTGDFLPSVYVLDPISRCNISCVMCPNSRMAQSQFGEISPEVFTDIIQTISPYAEFLMLYWMGEPLLHSNFSELLKVAREHIQGKIVVSSNMTVFDERTYQSLAENADIVLACIDRWDKAAYEKIRRGAKFDVVVEHTKLLLKACEAPKSRCQVVVKGLDIKHDSLEYEAFHDYWEQLGAKPLLAWLNTWASTMPGVRNAAQLAVPGENDLRVPCADLWFKMVLDWQGRTQMCCFDWQYANQISDERGANWLKRVWHGEKMLALRKMHIEANYQMNTLCKKCDSWGEPNEHLAYTSWSDDSYFIVF